MDPEDFDRGVELNSDFVSANMPLHLIKFTEQALEHRKAAGEERFDERFMLKIGQMLYSVSDSQYVEEGYISVSDGILIAAAPEGSDTLQQFFSQMEKLVAEFRLYTTEDEKKYHLDFSCVTDENEQESSCCSDCTNCGSDKKPEP